MSWLSSCIFESNITIPPKGVLANAVGSRIVVSWERMDGAAEYEIFEKIEGKTYQKIETTKEKTVIRSHRKRGCVYYYKVRAVYCFARQRVVGPFSNPSETRVPAGSVSTLKNLLLTALAPAGSTMYIWGGGWNEEDMGAGEDAVRVGLSEKWRRFALRQTEDYDYKNTRYLWGKGLDCSGYIGWTLYNVSHTEAGKEGLVVKAGDMAEYLAGKGWGSFRSAGEVKDYRTGDIMSTKGHVYLVLGPCPDGSVVLLHASPQGVQVNGTVTPEGSSSSMAAGLARNYMKSRHPGWHERFPECLRGISYLKDYDQFRFDCKGKFLSDPEGYQNRMAADILRDLVLAGEDLDSFYPDR